MADVKISGLPASTTPLAGTEVLPIVQSSVTKQVSVANLTAGRDVSANSFISAAGAVATPSITTTGDTNTGFWFPAADTLAVSTAGAERMRIVSGGNLGLGTTSPQAKLSVSNSGAAGYEFLVTNPSGGIGTYIQSFNRSTGAYVETHYYAASHTFRTNASATSMVLASTGVISLGAAPGSESLRATPVASAVNYLDVRGAATSGAPLLLTAGSDTNINLFVSTKGNGAHYFQTSSSGANQFVIAHTASTVNVLQVTGGATGVAPSMAAAGSDANIDIALTPKGTGVLRFGTYTAGILAQAGYITIKDAAGNTRNLLVG